MCFGTIQGFKNAQIEYKNNAFPLNQSQVGQNFHFFS